MGEHDGHRMRIREKLDSGVLREHEMLEALLFNAIPRRNTNELAHRLLAAFGSISGIFSATTAQLKQVEGVGDSVASFLYCIGDFYEKCYGARIEPKVKSQVYDTDKFLSYVRDTYGGVDREVLDLYALDENSKIVIRKRFSQDSLFNVEVSPEEIAQFLTENKASGLVMVHNHPFGEATASESDDYMTTKCQLICSMQNVLLCDHAIYAPDGVYSYYRSGRLKKITELYSVQNVFSESFLKGKKGND